MGDRGGTATHAAIQANPTYYTRWEIGGNRNQSRSHLPEWCIIPDGRSGGNRNGLLHSAAARRLYPMGDRGGTATSHHQTVPVDYYTRWEIGGEPQRLVVVAGTGVDYTRWEIGGEPQPVHAPRPDPPHYTRWEIGGEPQLARAYRRSPLNYTRWEIGGGTATSMEYVSEYHLLYPMGDRGGTATHEACELSRERLYPMGDRGGTATPRVVTCASGRLYPMGDRGGTATNQHEIRKHGHYTRWEIGGEPQRIRRVFLRGVIIPDGRSGGNRNS